MPATGTITHAKQDELVKLGERTFMRWLVEIELPDGDITRSSVLRMPDSSDPTGLQAEEKAQGGWKVAAKGNGGHTYAGSGSTDRGYGYQTNPHDAKRMGRCHAQEMALRYADIQCKRGKLPDDFNLETLNAIIDWFEKGVES